MTPPTIEKWHQVAKSRDLRALGELLADDVVFVSPVVHTPQIGKAITFKYLAAAMQVLNNDSFRNLKGIVLSNAPRKPDAELGWQSMPG